MLWRKRDYFFSTPRWYSYGGMFQSVFLAVNLARYYGKQLMFFYPGRHVHPGLSRAKSSAGPASAFLNTELKQIVVEGQTLGETTLIQKVVATWLDFNRMVWQHPFLRKLIGAGRRAFGKRFESLFPIFWGYSGLEDSNRLSDLLGISEPVNWKQVLRSAVPIDLTNEQKRRAEDILIKVGIPVGDEFVCLYVRDSGFESRRNATGALMANADISYFTSAISFLESKGFYVIRVGDPTMAPYDRGGPKFFDFVHSPSYCAVVDQYLYRHCAFWLGTMGGGRCAPLAYGRASIVVNGIYPPYSGYCVRPDDVYLPKHVYSKRLKRFLSLQEQLQTIDELAEGGPWGKEYVAIENTGDEIATIVREFYLWKFGGGFDWNPDLQSQYWSLKNGRVREAFYDGNSGRWKTMTLEETADLQPYISRKFLEQCWEMSGYLSELTYHYNSHGSLREFRPGAAMPEIMESRDGAQR